MSEDTRQGGVQTLQWIQFFSSMIADDRESLEIDIRDFMAGVYIADFERISKYWSDWESAEKFFCGFAGIRDPRQFYWLRFSAVMRHTEKSVMNKPMRSTDDLKDVIAQATAVYGEKLTSRHILCVVLDSGSSTGVALLDSGFNVAELRKDTQVGK